VVARGDSVERPGKQERPQENRAITVTFHNVLSDGRGIPEATVCLVDLGIIGAGPAGLAITLERTGFGVGCCPPGVTFAHLPG
jgi:hypothetical protein